jgi:hypothetical protein
MVKELEYNACSKDPQWQLGKLALGFLDPWKRRNIQVYARASDDTAFETLRP